MGEEIAARVCWTQEFAGEPDEWPEWLHEMYNDGFLAIENTAPFTNWCILRDGAPRERIEFGDTLTVTPEGLLSIVPPEPPAGTGPVSSPEGHAAQGAAPGSMENPDPVGGPSDPLPQGAGPGTIPGDPPLEPSGAQPQAPAEPMGETQPDQPSDSEHDPGTPTGGPPVSDDSGGEPA